MANVLTAFNSEAWSKRLVAKLDQINVMRPLVNTEWEGDLRNNKSVQVRTPGGIVLSSYSAGDTISYQDLKPNKQTFTVSDGSYFAFNVDDVDMAQTDLDALDIYTGRAAIALNDAVEAKLTAAYTSVPLGNQLAAATGTGATLTATISGGAVTGVTVGAGGSSYTSHTKVGFIGGGGAGAAGTITLSTGAIASIAITAGGFGYTSAPTVVLTSDSPITLDGGTTSGTSIYPLFTAARSIQSKQNVPSFPGARWAVVDPDTVSLLLNDTSHFIRASDLGDQVVQWGNLGGEMVARTAAQAPGFMGMLCGYMVYESNHIGVSSGSKFLLFGDNQAISYAAQIVKTESLRLQTTFANAVRGLLLHDTFVPTEAAKRLVYIRAAA